MDDGKRNRLVSVRRRVADKTPAGQPLEQWVEVFDAWANIRGKSGAQSIRADGPVSVMRYSIRIPYRTDVDETMRVYGQGVIYQIRAVLPDEERRRHVDLVCEVVHG